MEILSSIEKGMEVARWCASSPTGSAGEGEATQHEYEIFLGFKGAQV